MKPLLIVLMLFGLGAPVWADSSACPLTGIVGVQVKTVTDGDAPKVGIDQKTYNDKVLSMLGTAKVNVSTDSTAPMLFVEILGVETKDESMVALSVTANISENVTLPRTGVTRVFVQTWSASFTTLCGKYFANEEASACLTKCIDSFTTDYLKDNPTANSASK
jgi:hypothetical protein